LLRKFISNYALEKSLRVLLEYSTQVVLQLDQNLGLVSHDVFLVYINFVLVALLNDLENEVFFLNVDFVSVHLMNLLYLLYNLRKYYEYVRQFHLVQVAHQLG
jgi:hypothetical protein